jgi:hypothetical protein
VISWLFWWRVPALRRLVIVNLQSDENSALRGVLWSQRGSWLVLRQCALVVPNQQPKPMDGEVLVHRSNVSFIQSTL